MSKRDFKQSRDLSAMWGVIPRLGVNSRITGPDNTLDDEQSVNHRISHYF